MTQHDSAIVAEQAVLGACIARPEYYDSVAEVLSAEDFICSYEHRMIFEAISELYESAKGVDVVTVNARFRTIADNPPDDSLHLVGALAQEVPSPKSAKHYAELVRDHSVARSLALAGRNIQTIAEEGGKADQLLNDAAGIFNPLLESGTSEGFVSVRETAIEALEALQTRFESGGAISGLDTGLTHLNELTGGLQDSDMIVLAGRPSMGKTALAMNIAQHVAKTEPVLVFSLEMPRQALVNRMTSTVSGINFSKIKSGQLTEQDWPRLTAGIQQINELKIFIDDRAAPTIQQLRSRARVAARKYGCRLVVIDYLTLVHATGDNQNLRIAEVSRGIKEMAKELSCPVIVLSQLSREVDKRPDKRPLMSDLRDSGAIEQDADVIAFNYLEEKYDEDTPLKGICELIVRKQRNGETGTVYLDFVGQHMKFSTRETAVPSTEKKKKSGYRYKAD